MTCPKCNGETDISINPECIILPISEIALRCRECKHLRAMNPNEYISIAKTLMATSTNLIQSIGV